MPPGTSALARLRFTNCPPRQQLSSGLHTLSQRTEGNPQTGPKGDAALSVVVRSLLGGELIGEPLAKRSKCERDGLIGLL